MGQLRAAIGDAEVARLLEGVDGHTEFIYRRGYTEIKLPTHNTHAMVTREGGEGQQINRFFQVA